MKIEMRMEMVKSLMESSAEMYAGIDSSFGKEIREAFNSVVNDNKLEVETKGAKMHLDKAANVLTIVIEDEYICKMGDIYGNYMGIIASQLIATYKMASMMANDISKLSIEMSEAIKKEEPTTSEASDFKEVAEDSKATATSSDDTYKEV